MAKNDYFVIVYNFLSYLYQCLKRGEYPKEKDLLPDSKLFQINEKYWFYVVENLYKDGYITGLSIKYFDDEASVEFLEKCQITPQGIQYLFENSMLEKAKKFARTVGEIVVPIL